MVSKPLLVSSRWVIFVRVVLAVDYKEENSLYNELQFEIPEIYVLGDAKNVANIMYGIWDAFEVANHID